MIYVCLGVGWLFTDFVISLQLDLVQYCKHRDGLVVLILISQR